MDAVLRSVLSRSAVLVGLSLLSLTGVPSVGNAAPCTSFPYTLTNGTTADATQVMANYTYLSGCLAPLASPSFTGDVGMGTSSPTANLEVYGTGAKVLIGNPSATGPSQGGELQLSNSYSYNTLEFNNGINADPTDGSIGMYTTYGGGSSFPWAQYGALVFYTRNDASNGWVDFRTGSGSGLTDRMVISPSGNVGIGTTSPGAKLDVVGPNGTTGLSILSGTQYVLDNNGSSYLQISGGSSAGSGVYFACCGTTSFIDYTSTAGGMRFYVAGTEAMFISGSSRVGIGTTSPAQALEVNGEVKVDTLASASSTTLCVNANVLSSCSSSIRYKENVKPATFGLTDVEAMRPVTFKWKGRDENDFGFIAEDMEKINPLFVTYKGGKVEGVKYPQLTAVLAKAIQEQQAQIEALKSANTHLMADIGRREAKIDAQERELSALEKQNASLAVRVNSVVDRLDELENRVRNRNAALDKNRYGQSSAVALNNHAFLP